MAIKNYKYGINILEDSVIQDLLGDYTKLEARVYRLNGGFEKKWTTETPTPPEESMVIVDNQILITIDDDDWDDMVAGGYQVEVCTSLFDPDMEDDSFDDTFDEFLLRKS